MTRTSVLRRPPSGLWSKRRHRAIHLLEGDFPNLDFLASQSESLTELTVTAFVDDVEALGSLRKLTRLTMWPMRLSSSSRWVLDLSSMPNLRYLSVGRGVSLAAGGRTQARLRHLHVDGMTKSCAELVESGLFPDLRELRIDGPRSIPKIIPKSVSELSISLVKKWATVSRFVGLGGLEYLQLEGIRGMEDLRVFAAAPPLRRLYVEDCPELQSIDGIELREDAEYAFVGRVPLRSTLGTRWSVPDG